MNETTVTLSFRWVTITPAGSHVRVHAEMSMDDLKEALVSLLYKLDRKDTVELADRLNEELYR